MMRQSALDEQTFTVCGPLHSSHPYAHPTSILHWPSARSMMSPWLGRPESPSRLPANSDSLTFREAPVIALYSPFRAIVRPRVRGLLFIASLGLAAVLGLSLLRPRAVALEAAAETQQPAASEPVGAVDDDDLLKAGSNRANWL